MVKRETLEKQKNQPSL